MYAAEFISKTFRIDCMLLNFSDSTTIMISRTYTGEDTMRRTFSDRAEMFQHIGIGEDEVAFYHLVYTYRCLLCRALI